MRITAKHQGKWALLNNGWIVGPLGVFSGMAGQRPVRAAGWGQEIVWDRSGRFAASNIQYWRGQPIPDDYPFNIKELLEGPHG